MLKITVLTDNNPGGSLRGEWGFCAYIEYNGRKILLDTGSTGLFLRNAEKLGLSVAEVDYGVLSHAHYDHAGGMMTFFRSNDHAPFYLQKDAAANCYHRRKLLPIYIGIPYRVFRRYDNRLIRADGLTRIEPGVTLIGHTTPGLAEIGQREKMFLKNGLSWCYDDFRHEQSLVLECAQGLVVLNSCSHGGVVNILREVRTVYPDTPILSMIGGFHIHRRSAEEIRALGEDIRATGVGAVYTGHCSGDRGCAVLKETNGLTVEQFRTGFTLEYC